MDSCIVLCSALWCIPRLGCIERRTCIGDGVRYAGQQGTAMSKRDSKSSVSDAVFPPICKYMCVCWPPRPRLQVHRSPVHLSPLTKEQELSETTIGSIIRVRSLRFCLDFVVVIAREDKREHGREGGRERWRGGRGAWRCVCTAEAQGHSGRACFGSGTTEIWILSWLSDRFCQMIMSLITAEARVRAVAMQWRGGRGGCAGRGCCGISSGLWMSPHLGETPCGYITASLILVLSA